MDDLFRGPLAVIVTIGLVGCGATSGRIESEDLQKVSQGMDADEVRLLLGDPASANDARMGTPHDWRCYYYSIDGKLWELQFDAESRLDKKMEYDGGDIIPWPDYVRQCKSKGSRL